MDLDLAKGVCIIGLFFGTLLFGCLPYFLVARGDPNPKSIKIRDLLISYFKCFGGGVFMSACLVDLLPEGMRSMEQYFEMVNIKPDFPVFLVLTAAGFFIIAFVELLAHTLLHKSKGHGGESSCSGQSPEGSCNDAEAKTGVEMKEIYQLQYSEIKLTEETNKCHTSGKEIVKQDADHGHDEAADIITAISGNSMRAFLLLVALSFHTVFDGLAVGLKKSEKDVWKIFTAIIIHKLLVSTCLGLQLFLVYKDRPVKAFLWTAFFSLIAPMGIGIGMGLTSGQFDEIAKQLVSTILQGLSTGTFLYVTFFEILREELVDNKGFVRLLVVIVGFSAMALVNYFCH